MPDFSIKLGTLSSKREREVLMKIYHSKTGFLSCFDIAANYPGGTRDQIITDLVSYEYIKYHTKQQTYSLTDEGRKLVEKLLKNDELIEAARREFFRYAKEQEEE